MEHLKRREAHSRGDDTQSSWNGCVRLLQESPHVVPRAWNAWSPVLASSVAIIFQLDRTMSTMPTRCFPWSPLTRFSRVLMTCTSSSLHSWPGHCFDKGVVIFPEGDQSREFYLLVHGMVALEIMSHGTQHRVQTLHAGDEFGFSALLSGKRRYCRRVHWIGWTCWCLTGIAAGCVQDRYAFGMRLRMRLVGVVSERLSAAREQCLICMRRRRGGRGRENARMVITTSLHPHGNIRIDATARRVATNSRTPPLSAIPTAQCVGRDVAGAVLNSSDSSTRVPANAPIKPPPIQPTQFHGATKHELRNASGRCAQCMRIPTSRVRCVTV